MDYGGTFPMILLKLAGFFRKELVYLRELSQDQRFLLGSTFLYALALPTITTFSNTYLWRQSKDPVVLAIFNIGYFAGLSIGVFLNGLLLRWFSPQKLCAVGCLLQGLVPMVLVFLGAEAETYVVALGLTLGISGGFYWGNRNLLTSQVSQGESRFKFISLENVLQISAAVLAPLAVGWFLVLGEQTGAYSVQSAYQWSAIVGFFLLLLSGWCVAGVAQVFAPVKRLFLSRPSQAWNRMRVLDFFNGCTSGVEASILFFALLVFLDEENAIGTLLSFTAILAVLGMYTLGKRAKHRDHAAILGLWMAVTLVGKIIFAVLYSAVGAIILQTLEGLTRSFRWASMAAVLYETLDAQKPCKKTNERYAYLMDREFVLNVGRVSALVVVVLVYQQAPEILIRYGLFAIVGTQLIMILLTRQLTRDVSHHPST